jgi:hypothetical protein
MSLWDPQFAQAGKQITIIKEGSDPAFTGADKSTHTYTITHPTPTYAPDLQVGMTGGRRHKTKTIKTFPRSILKKTGKVLPSNNPSKAPPTRKSVKLMTISGIEKARKTAKARAMKTDIGTIRKKLIEKKIIGADKKNIPPTVLRTLYADSVGAGLLSSA